MAIRVSALIFFDKLFTPVYQILSWVSPIFFPRTKQSDKIIAIKLFGMGSIVRIAAVLKKANFPLTQLQLITLTKNKAVCELLGIEAHFVRSENPIYTIVDILNIFWNVWRMKNTSIIDLERTSNLSGIFRLLLAIGKSPSSFTFESRNFESRNQTFISLKDKPAIQGIAEIFKVELKQDTQSGNRIRGNKVVVNVNAGEYLPQRKYPIKYFTTVIKELNEKGKGFEFILTGSKKEREYVSLLTNQLDLIGISYTNTAGDLSLKDLADLLQSSRLLITNDSGPLHLANYFNVPAVAIWGPTAAKLVGYPNSNQMKNISLEKECSPCFFHPKSKVALACSNRIDCLQELNPELVVDAALDLLQQNNELMNNVG